MMSERQHIFFTATSKHKRKRSENEASLAVLARVVKRPSVPVIRSPPSAKSFHSNSSIFSPFSRQFPSVETPQDESINEEDKDILMSSPRLPDLHISSESSPWIKVEAIPPHPGPDSFKVAADTSSTPPNSQSTFQRTGRARSNDIFSSQPRPPTPQEYLCMPSNQNAIFHYDRIPTPITGHFNTSLPYVSPSSRHTPTSIHTDLSPMIEQETWGASLHNSIPRSHPIACGSMEVPPSPIVDTHESTWSGQPFSTPAYMSGDGDTGMVLDDDSTMTSLSSLRVSGEDNDMPTDHQLTWKGAQSSDNDFSEYPKPQKHDSCLQDMSEDSKHPPQRPPGHTRNTSSLTKNGRMARLHMGFLAGCEKCAQQVPGHYSHILR